MATLFPQTANLKQWRLGYETFDAAAFDGANLLANNNTTQAWQLWAFRAQLAPGTYYFDDFSILMSSTNVSSVQQTDTVAFGIYQNIGGELTQMAVRSRAVTESISTTFNTLTYDTSSDPIKVTFVSGGEYYLVLMFRKIVGTNALYPYFRNLGTTFHPGGASKAYYFDANNAETQGAGIPSAVTLSAASSNSTTQFRCNFRTAISRVMNVGAYPYACGTSATTNGAGTTLTDSRNFNNWGTVAGDKLYILDGTGVTLGEYVIQSVSGTSVVLNTSAGASATGIRWAVIRASETLWKGYGATLSENVYIPRRVGATTHVVLRGVSTQATKTQFLFNYKLGTTTGSGSRTLTNTMIVDMGATDQITFAGANAALVNGAENADIFDMCMTIRPNGANSDLNLFYQNKERGSGNEGTGDYCTKGHYQVVNTARGVYSAAGTPTAPEFVSYLRALAVDGIVEALEVCDEIMVLLGDSQTASQGSNFPLLGRNDPIRLGNAVRNTFSEWSWWVSGISGNRVTATVGSTHTGGFARWNNATAGLGDLIDMYPHFLSWNGFGINDISAYVTGAEGSTEAFDSQRRIVAEICYRLTQILESLVVSAGTNVSRAMLFGTPPFPGLAGATAQKDEAVLLLNAAVKGIAAGFRCAFYDPWSYVNSDIDNNLSGSHYVDASALFVAQQMRRNFDSNQTQSVSGGRGGQRIRIGYP